MLSLPALKLFEGRRIQLLTIMKQTANVWKKGSTFLVMISSFIPLATVSAKNKPIKQLYIVDPMFPMYIDNPCIVQVVVFPKDFHSAVVESFGAGKEEAIQATE